MAPATVVAQFGGFALVIRVDVSSGGCEACGNVAVTKLFQTCKNPLMIRCVLYELLYSDRIATEKHERL